MQKAKDVVVDVTAGFLSDAEKELAAFARAVQELCGAGQVRQSIEDWIEELESMDWRCEEAVPDWRGITIAAAVRLASRSSALPQSRGRKDPQTHALAACHN
jgi:hypothetical protein